MDITGIVSHCVCNYSMVLPYKPGRLQEEALMNLLYEPVTGSMVTHVAQAARGFVPNIVSTDTEKPPPDLEVFINSVISASKVGTLPLLVAFVYIARAKSKLGPANYGIPTTPHRIFLASLIVSVKFLEDGTHKNKKWVKYARMNTKRATLKFSLDEVNIMEKELLGYLDYNAWIRGHELFRGLKTFQ